MESTNPDCYLYVSTDLRHFEICKSYQVAQDLVFNGTIYRRLDPKYYAWLRRRIDAAFEACDAGLCNADDVADTLSAFAEIDEWAAKKVGRNVLDAARKMGLKGYQGPGE